MAKRRRFTAEFKAKVVLEALSDETTQAEVCRRHNLNENQPHGCLHPSDQSVADQSALEPISDAQTATTNKCQPASFYFGSIRFNSTSGVKSVIGFP